MCSRARGARLGVVCAALSVAAAGCGGSEQRTSLPAVIASVEPACASNAEATPIAIHGTMPVKPVVSLSDSNQSTLETGYRAWVGEVELAEVHWVDGATVAATVPSHIAPGVYPVAIVTPFGERFTLDGAFQVATGFCNPGRGALTLAAEVVPAVVRVGDRFVVNVTVRNTGQAAVTGVKTTVAAPPAFTLFQSPPDALDIPGEQTRTFTWTYTAAAGAGTGTFTVNAAGVDSSTGQPVSAPEVKSNAVAAAYAVEGAVSGLAGTGLVLRLNGANDLTVAAGATSFAFPSALPSGTQFAVTIAAQPSGPTQTCSVSAGSGTVGTGNVSVVVNCGVNTFTVGGNVTGLAGSGLVLHEATSNQDVPVTSGGTYAFQRPIDSGRSYAVTVKTQPANPSQTCAVANGAGTVGSANVTNVNVTCTTSTFSVGGSVTGLAGSGLVLRLNGVTDRAVASSGPFSFAGIPSGTQYTVSVQTQPTNPTQTCAVADGTGTVASADVTNIAVTCTTATFTISGTVAGLSPTGSGLVLRDGTRTVAVPAGGTSFSLPAAPSGTLYDVVVQTQPTNPTQQCTVANGAGTLGSVNVTNVAVTCVTSSFTVGGSVTGLSLSGTGLVLRLNGVTDLQVKQNGAYAFPAIPSGTPYNVVVQTQPTGPTQSCTVTNGTGVVGGANVTSVNVSCATTAFTVGGSVAGLVGRGLVLRLNGGSDLDVPAGSTSFVFASPVASGAAYAVTVRTQPSSPKQTCTVANGAGTVTNAPVTDVSVSCTGSTFALTTSWTGSGSLLCNGVACATTADYPAGTIVAIAKDPASTGTLLTILVDDAVAPGCDSVSCQVTMTADHKVTATFVP